MLGLPVNLVIGSMGHFAPNTGEGRGILERGRGPWSGNHAYRLEGSGSSRFEVIESQYPCGTALPGYVQIQLRDHEIRVGRRKLRSHLGGARLRLTVSNSG